MYDFFSMKFTQRDIRNIFDKVKRQAIKACGKARYDRAIRYVECATMIAYQTNEIYADDDLEELIGSLSRGLIVQSTGTPRPMPGKIVFYDSSGIDNVALTQQYLTAFATWNIELLYILNNPYSNARRAAYINDALRKNDKATVFCVPSHLTRSEAVRAIHREIIAFVPEKILLHLAPSDVVPLIVCNALSQCERYLINITDHAFWLGRDSVDYFLEFRNFGITISTEKRKIDPKRLLLQYYYPIISCQPFRGLPPVPDDRAVRIFSGGALYKIYGENERHFGLLRLLLNHYPEVVIYIAGSGNEAPIRRFIHRNGYENRLHLIGQRDDIVHVFRNIDIYLSTYPIGGGLMTQLAAYCSVPVLAFADKNISCKYIDELLPYGPQGDRPIVRGNIEEFCCYAERLIGDKTFRKAEGEALHSRLLPPEAFSRSLHTHLFGQSKQPASFVHVPIDYEAITAIYMEVENRYMHNCVYELVSVFQGKMLWLFPKATASLIRIVLKKETLLRIVSRIKKGYGLFRRN